MSIDDKCFDCKTPNNKKNDMGEHGYTTYCTKCKIATYHKHKPIVPLNYEMMKQAAMKTESYNFYEGDGNE